MNKVMENIALAVFVGFAFIVFLMTAGCANRCRSYADFKLQQVERDIETARDKSIIVSDYNWNVVKLFDDLKIKVRDLHSK